MISLLDENHRCWTKNHQMLYAYTTLDGGLSPCREKLLTVTASSHAKASSCSITENCSHM